MVVVDCNARVSRRTQRSHCFDACNPASRWCGSRGTGGFEGCLGEDDEVVDQDVVGVELVLSDYLDTDKVGKALRGCGVVGTNNDEDLAPDVNLAQNGYGILGLRR